MTSLIDGSELWGRYDSLLAPYAQTNQHSRGRQHAHVPDPWRLPFQRDRDRIIHSKSFRRLRGKSQVVSPNRGDHFRNRLSHTLEVSQIARDLARDLFLNEDLAETIALAHDLGHPPFGHTGERTLNDLLQPHGLGFDHNQHSLRLVTTFENPYAPLCGLNLSHETLEGMQKHESEFLRENGRTIAWPHLEGPLVDIADEIAYLSADLQDGFRAELITPAQLDDLSLWKQAQEIVESDNVYNIARAVIRVLIQDLSQNTRQQLEQQNIQSLEQVQKHSQALVCFSPAMATHFRETKQFLMTHYYQSDSVTSTCDQGAQMIRQVFLWLQENPQALPPHEESSRFQVISDFIAGMTDEFLLRRWQEATA